MPPCELFLIWGLRVEILVGLTTGPGLCCTRVSTALCCSTIVIKRIYDGVEAETRKSHASFQIIQSSDETRII